VFGKVSSTNVFVGSQFSFKEPAMLVLSRHRDESIMIGDNVMITIVDIRGDKVRLGIDAPQEIPVQVAFSRTIFRVVVWSAELNQVRKIIAHLE
jgi:carbon storage regulator CsrA